MTKKQTLAACVALAPDFKLTFERPKGVDTLIASATTDDGPLALSMPVAGLGRAAVETRLLDAALARLRRRAA